MKSKVFLAALLTIGLMDASIASSKVNACNNPNGHDPLVGVWYGSFSADSYVGFGTVTINADGTAMAGDTTNTGGLGNLATTPTGLWKKIDQSTYQLTAITIYSSIATLPNPTLPAYTFVEHAKVKLSADCMQMTSFDDTYSVYAPDDFKFANPLKSGTLSQTYSRITFN